MFGKNFIIRKFKNKNIKILRRDGRIWITSRAIAKGLDIDRTNVIQLYNRNKTLLESHSSVIKIITEKGPRNIRIFDRTAFIWICIRSNSPNALPFQEWVLNVIDEILKNGYYSEKSITDQNVLKEIQSLREDITILNDKLLILQDSSFKKKKRHEIILEQLYQTPYLTANELGSKLNLSKSSIYRYLYDLCEHNLVLMQELPSQGKGRPAKIYYSKKLK